MPWTPPCARPSTAAFPTWRTLQLVDYKVRVINSEAATAAGVRVVIESRDEHEVWGTVGVSENVIEASWIALVDSFEYKLCKDEDRRRTRSDAVSDQRHGRMAMTLLPHAAEQQSPRTAETREWCRKSRSTRSASTNSATLLPAILAIVRHDLITSTMRPHRYRTAQAIRPRRRPKSAGIRSGNRTGLFPQRAEPGRRSPTRSSFRRPT